MIKKRNSTERSEIIESFSRPTRNSTESKLKKTQSPIE